MNNQITNAQSGRSCLLRLALLANATFSGFCGVIILLACKPLASLLGPVKPLDLSGLAISLMFFSAALIWTARSANVRSASAWIFVGLDVAWVVASGGLIFAGGFTTTGNWIVGVVADIVLLFAVAQILGIRKLRGTPSD
jgi:hypothetical protein